MKHFILLVTIFFLFAGASFGQSKAERKADDLYDLNKFSEAIPLYQKALQKDDSKTIKTKLANCYRRTNQMVKAEELYAEVIQSGRFNDKVLLYYSETLMTNEKYEDAKDYLKSYITRKPDDEKAHLLLASCNAVKTIQPYFPIFSKKRFTQNSENDDSSPVYYRNGIAFTSDRSQGTKFLKKKSGWTGRDYAMIYYSAQNIDGTFEIPVSLSPKFNDLNINSGPISFTADGKYAVFGRNSKVANNSDEYPMQLYSAEVDQDGKWRDVELISFCRNTTTYMHPALSPDGRLLYYVTDRRSGQGGTDIYVAKRKTDGTWGEPENLGPIVNTALNEGFPFTHADGRLFFSSKGHPGYGGFDLFVTQLDAKGNWTTPVNLGRPVNSSVDDVSFFLFEDEKGGFYSSAVDQGNDDIYLFSLTDEEDFFVRLEDDPEKKVFANNPVTSNEKTSNNPTQEPTETQQPEEIPAEEPVYQPAAEVVSNEPFDDGQTFDNKAQQPLIKSGDQEELAESKVSEESSQQPEIDKVIISDTQVSDKTSAPPTTPDERVTTITDLESIGIKKSVPPSSQPTNKSTTVEEKVTAADEDYNSATDKTESIAAVTNKEDMPNEQPVDKKAITNKEEIPAKDVDETLSSVTDQEALPGEQSEKKEMASTPEPKSQSEPEEEIAQKDNKEPQNQRDSQPTQIENPDIAATEDANQMEEPSISNPTESTAPTTASEKNNTSTPSNTTQDFEVYPGKEPDLQPEVVEEVRPFREPAKTTSKAIDAFGAIEQELSNKTLSVGRTFVLPGVKYPFNAFVFQVSESIRYELDRLANLLKDNPELRVEIGCYSESFGEDKVNKALSQYRAKAAVDYLVSRGIDSRRLIASGYGETKPLNQCVNGVLCTRDDHMVNQRMEVKVLSF